MRQRRNYTAEHNALCDRIILAVSASRLACVWEQPTGAAYRNGELIRYGLKGSADISGILFDGRRLEIEVKTGKAVQQQNQINFMRMIRKFGGIYLVARSVEEVLHELTQIKLKTKPNT